MATTTFIYALVDPRTRHVRYVGKADDPEKRLREHFKLKGKNSWLNNWLSQLISLNLEPSLRIIMEVPRNDWQQWEKHWITAFRWAGEKITNITDGGTGGAWNKGVPTPEHVKEKISKIAKQTHRTPEYRAKQSQAAKLQWASMTPEERKHMLRGARKPKSNEHKRKLGQAHLGVPLTDTHKKAISNSHPWRGKKRPEQSIAMKAHYQKPGAREKTGMASKKAWAKRKNVK